MRRTPAEVLRTARSRRGRERDAAVAVVKTISATLASYALATWALDPQVAVFAPFAALFTVQATVYRSVWHGIRYLAAVVIGVAAAGLVGGTLGQNFWTLAVLVVGAVLVGQWRGFAGYGSQIALVGLFAFGVGGGDESGFLIDLLLAVLAGTLTGLVANLIFAPRLRFNDAAQAVADMATAVSDLLVGIAEGLRSDDPLHRAGSWRERTHELDSLIDRVHADVDFREEVVRFNPRRVAMRQPTLAGTRATIITISAVVDHTESITRALLYADRSDGDGLDDSLLPTFLPKYADLLESVAAAVDAFGHHVVGTGDDLDDHLSTAHQRHQELAQLIYDERPSDTRMLADCGAMLLAAERLLSELESGNVQ